MKDDRITLEDVPYELQQLRQDVVEIRNFLLNQAATTAEPKYSVPEKEIMTVAEVSHLLTLSKGAIYNMCSARLIPFYKRGGRNYFDRKEIYEWMREDGRKTIKQLQGEAERDIQKNN